MYNYNDFKDNIDLGYFTDTILLAVHKFNWSKTLYRHELMGYGDSWQNLACIDKLVELGYIAVVEEKEVSQFTTYRNIRL